MEINNLIVEIDNALTSAFVKLNEWFAAPEDLRNFRPKEGAWTINEVLEHVGITNKYLLILIEKGAAKALKNLNGLDLADELANYSFQRTKLDEIGLHLSFPWMRPAHMEPTGVLAPAETAQTLQAQLLQCQRVLRDLPNGEGLLYSTTMTVNELGKLNVYEFLYFLAKHAERHLTQIDKIIAKYRSVSR